MTGFNNAPPESGLRQWVELDPTNGGVGDGTDDTPDDALAAPPAPLAADTQRPAG